MFGMLSLWAVTIFTVPFIVLKLNQCSRYVLSMLFNFIKSSQNSKKAEYSVSNSVLHMKI